ncbi:ABC transporter ATP-binding protein [Lacrimispora sp.]|uniref:ABC transporter ATP-binding protein n=1 Tax=Lacrimispora sp. TaxID=2719234 RepID=UPI0028A71AD9|nr:ABC transporter ATP-binding protein [Lacrimispora sp.]
MKIKNLLIDYKSAGKVVHAVRDLNLSINEGETFGLVGETGAGKTTTALSILRILPEISVKLVTGQIEFNGSDLLKKSRKEMRKIRGKDIAMIFQDPMTSLDPVNTVGSQIEEMIQLHSNLSKKEIRKAAEQMFETVGIRKERFDDYPHQFSGGMKQRVVIAIALSCNPRLLIADEPTTALDVTIQAQILELMRGLKKKYGTAMIMITHDLGVVADICDTVSIMYAGQIVEYGTVEEIYSNHKHPYTDGLFHSIPDIDMEQNKLKVIDGLTPDPTNIPDGCAFHPRCPFAIGRCSKEEPDYRNVGGRHLVKCFLETEEEGCK